MALVPASIRNKPTRARVVELIDYDPATGVFKWRNRSIARKAKNGIAGWVNDEGYRRITIDGRMYMATHLAWLIVHGVWPPAMIDHINRDTDDNRISNLRAASNSQNQMNKKARSSSAAKLKGVAIVRKRAGLRYRPQIYIAGKLITFGLFKTPEEAHAIYCREAAARFGEFARFS